MRASSEMAPVLNWLRHVDKAQLEQSNSHVKVYTEAGKYVTTGGLNAHDRNKAVTNFISECQRFGLLQEYGRKPFGKAKRERRAHLRPTPQLEVPASMQEEAKVTRTRQYPRVPKATMDAVHTLYGLMGRGQLAEMLGMSPSGLQGLAHKDPPTARSSTIKKLNKAKALLKEYQKITPQTSRPEPEPEPEPITETVQTAGAAHVDVVAQINPKKQYYDHPLLDEMFKAMDARNWVLLEALASVAKQLPELN